MREIGDFICSVGLLAFIISSAIYIFHRRVILKGLVQKKLDEKLWNDPDFNYEYYTKYFK